MFKILVIDDDQGTCSFVRDSLEATGKYEVTEAYTGKEGLRAAKTDEPDLILLDILLPDISGLEVLKKFHESKSTCFIPVVIISGVRSKEAKEDACHEFADGYIVKPFDPETLEAAIARTLKYHGPSKG